MFNRLIILTSRDKNHTVKLTQSKLTFNSSLIGAAYNLRMELIINKQLTKNFYHHAFMLLIIFLRAMFVQHIIINQGVL